MSYFPICLDIAGRRCIVIGGGRVAERKASSLLDCGGSLTIISPELSPGLQALHGAGAIDWLGRSYEEGDLKAAFLVIAATDDPNVQARIHAEAEEGNILLNVADVPKWCNFILPATVSRGDLNVAISTSGNSPALARKLRKKLEIEFGAEYEPLLDVLGALRSFVLGLDLGLDNNKILFENLLHDDFATWMKNKDWPKVADHIQTTLGPHFKPSCLDMLKTYFV